MKKTLGLFLILAMLGSLTRPAFAQIAPGVQQAAGQTATITGTVALSDGTFVGGADVKLIGPAVLSTTSDAHGSFQFTSVPHGIYTVVASAGSLGIASKTNIVVNTDVSIQIQYAKTSTTLKTIANVTTKAIGAHINVTAASVYSVTPRDFAFEGNTSWRQMLEQVPGVAVNGASFGGEYEEGIVNGPFTAQVISINGALPYETATQLDGMPFSNVTFGTFGDNGATSADLSTLPMDAFDAADIVRGPGANSPSIVDSIGGSMILHAPGAVTGNHYTFSFSNDPYGGLSANSLLQFKIGSKASVQLGYDMYNSPGPQGLHSSYLVPGIIQPGSINGQPFFGCNNPYSAAYSPYYSYLCYWVNAPIYGEFAPTNTNAQCSLKYTGCDDYLAGLMYNGMQGSTGSTKHGYTLGINYKFSPNVTGQLFYSGSHITDQGGWLSYLFRMDFEPQLFGAGYTGPQPLGQHLFNENGYVSEPVDESSWMYEERITANIGSGGILRVSALQNNTYFNYNTPGVPSGNYTVYGVGYYCNTDPNIGCSAPGQEVAFNGSVEHLDFSTSNFIYKEYEWSENRDILLSYGQQLGPRVSLGASYVQSYLDEPWYTSYEISQGTDYCKLYAALCLGQDPSVSQTTREFRYTLHDDVSDKLAIDGSYYFARPTYHIYNCTYTQIYYSASGCHAFNDFVFPYRSPRFSVTWRSSPDIALRGAVGGGFSIPLEYQLTGTSSATPDCSAGSYCIENIQNLNLQPEKSFSFDVGADVRIHRNTAVSLDIYRTNLFGQFYQKYSYGGYCASCGGLPLYIYQTNNLVPTRYEGVNLSVSHDPGPRGVYWNVGLGLSRSFIRSLPDGFYNSGPGYVCTNTTLAFCSGTELVPGINYTGGNYGISGAQPYSSASASIGFRWNPQTSISLSPFYYGPNNDYYRQAFVSWDGAVSYGVNKHITLLATFRNLLNTNGGNNICWNCYQGEVGAPSGVGPPYYTVPDPVGPRTMIVTLKFHG